MDGVKCLNPWDPQSKHIVATDGISEALCAGEKRWGSLPPNVLVQMDGRLVCFDVYNMDETGSVAKTLNSSRSDSDHVPIVCLNDQGGKVMDVSDKAATLRAQEHGHQPVICFEPGIMSRDCSAGNRSYIDVCSTLRAQMGDNKPAVCYALKGNFIDRETQQNGIGWREGVEFTLDATDRHGVCYAIDHAITTGGNCTAQGPCVYENVCPTQKASGVHAVCYGISRSMLKGGMNAGGMPVEEEIQPAITANGCGAVCINSSGLGIASALDASYYKGQGVRLGIEREFVAIRK